MIKVTKSAADKFNEIRKDSENPEKAMLRVSFGGYGWGGPRFRLTLDELIEEDDIVMESEGIKVVYSSNLEIYLNETVIDYSDNWFSRGFSIRGGNTSSCWIN